MDRIVKQLLPKISGYCSYQDRCRQDIIKRLEKWECPEEHWETILEWLRDNKFWNEERFAASFVRGKFRGNKWGKRKISMALYQKGIDQEMGKKAMETEIPEQEYYDMALKLALKKLEQLLSKEDQKHILKGKTLQYLAGKGFEPEICYNAAEDAIYELIEKN
ncbi:regulatory protein RecX [Flammeovirga pacifica]|uniref:Regulatory protein RecX n=1 Tax=Flammeovirga pacifica TaxID=915059 RepID=A0A1S1YYZ6_FLAPC|nr:regulatory protein RecX [Flammeovirga pacifica]OHX66222.1 hypothetical protein NH26_07590 [Flammeovirga pacifica]